MFSKSRLSVRSGDCWPFLEGCDEDEGVDGDGEGVEDGEERAMELQLVEGDAFEEDEKDVEAEEEVEVEEEEGREGEGLILAIAVAASGPKKGCNFGCALMTSRDKPSCSNIGYLSPPRHSIYHTANRTGSGKSSLLRKHCITSLYAVVRDIYLL